LNNKLLSLTIFLSFFVLSNITHAKSLADRNKVNQVNEYFMSQLVAGEFESAYALMTAYLGVDAQQFEERGKKAAQSMKQLQQNQGKPLSFALLKTQSIDEHFYKASYLLKYSAAAIIWELNYYQPDQGWRLVDISFNADINALFED